MSFIASLGQRRRLIGGLVLTIAAALLVVGCGGGGSSSTSAPSQGEDTTAETHELTTPAAEIPSEATVAFNSAVVTLDPDLAVGPADSNVVGLIAGRLYEPDADGIPVPALAESGKASPDNLKWTFELKPGLVFSDGSKLTANDVAATFERTIHDPSNATAGLFAPIKNVKASGARTVVFNLNQPYTNLPGLLAEEFSPILPASKLGDESFYKKPISAGPYKIDSWDGGTVTLEANDRYFGPKPAIKNLKFVTIEDPNSRLAQLQSGQIDFVYDMPPSFLPTLENSSDVSGSVSPTYGTYTLDMWNHTPPLDDVNVRKAISLAIDRDQLNEVIWQGQNSPVSGFWPPTMAGYEPSTEQTTADEAAAKKLLAGTECENGCTIKLEYPPALVPFSDQMALLIADDLEKIGIKLKLVKVDFNTFYADLAGKYQLAIYGMYDFVNQPSGLLTYGLDPEGGIESNFSGYDSPQMRKLISKTLAAEGAELTTALKEVNELFAEDQPYATLATWAFVPATRLPDDLIWVDGSMLHIGTTE